MTLSPPLLQLESVTLTHAGRCLLGPISLDVAIGDRLCVLGPPGTGKSLLLELMAGRHVLSSGRRTYPAFVAWHPDSALGVAPRFAIQLVSTKEQRRVSSQLATFYQARWHALFTEPDTVETFLSSRRVYALNDFEVPPSGLIASDHAERRLEILSQLALGNLLPRRVAALSNGELRKLLLARAMLARPKLLLLDDPLGGLDPEARLLVTQALIGYCNSTPAANQSDTSPHAWREKGEALTLVVTTPRPEELRPLISRSVELSKAHVSVPQKNPQAAGIAADGANRRQQHRSPIVKMTRATVHAGELVILNSVTLQVQKGEHWLITGPNGSGKSTLLALLLGEHPQSYVVDLEVLGLRAEPGVPLFERKRQIGHMAPELALHYPPEWSVREVVLSGFADTIGHYGQAYPQDEQCAEKWLTLLDLAEQSRLPFGNLTEAEQRRVFLARALVRKPLLLLLDEPTQGLVESERRWVYELLDEIIAERDLTLILVSHHPAERPRCITHHLKLRAGQVVARGPI